MPRVVRHAVLALLLATPAGPAAALLMVEKAVTPLGGGVFHYDITIANDTPVDVIIVSIVDAPLGDALLAATLSVPPGYLGSYDAGLGFLDFFEDTQLFGASTNIGGFGFDSTSGPASGLFSSFEAFTILGGFVSGGVTMVPEPSSHVLVGSGLLALALRRRSAAAVRREA